MKNSVGTWLSVDQKPEKSGAYLVIGETGEPESPWVQMAWWSKDNDRWECIFDYWAENISHYCKVVQPESFKKKEKDECP